MPPVEQLLEFPVPPDCAGTRLDRCLSRLIAGSSRASLQRLIRDGKVSDAGSGEVLLLPRFPVRGGMRIAVAMPVADPEGAVPAAEPFAFPILYEDAAMLVIDKPAAVVVHPAAGNPAGTVVNALYGRYPELLSAFGNAGRPGIVHRLDKETSGCLVIAKTPEAMFKLGNAFAERRTEKTYLAIVRGIPAHPSGEITGAIGRHPVNRQKMAVVERNGKSARTVYRLLASSMTAAGPLALLSVRIFTGRTHQIRVHLSSIGYPVLGDSLYGGSRMPVPGVERQMLHAWRLALPHPLSGERMEFSAPPPPDFLDVLDFMGIGGGILRET